MVPFLEKLITETLCDTTGMQTVDPARGAIEPLVHVKQVVDPVSFWYVPGMHAIQLNEP